jgi:hypothetical protein
MQGNGWALLGSVASRIAAAVVPALVLCGCSGGEGREGASAAPAASAPRNPSASPGAPGCDPPSPVRPWKASSFTKGFPEVQGTGRGAELWGLVMMRGVYPPFPVGDEVKVVWRMTGTGPLRLTLTGPDGRVHRLLWGPEEHGGSSYDRPGGEWGSGFRFTEPGCWHVRATRGAAVADAWLQAG